jgi:hypothetical protein
MRIDTTTTRDARVLRSVQRLLSATLLTGSLGTLGELLLLGHTGEATQWFPIVVLVCAVIVVAWQAIAPGRAAATALTVLMAAFVLVGALGVVLHYRSNAEFERELHPTEQGLLFLRKTATGATPLLAPGSMVLLGLIGLIQVYSFSSQGSGTEER